MSSLTRLFVGNLPQNTNENDVQKAFSTFGIITNLDLKCKSAEENPTKSFAFITISASAQNIESCIKHFSNSDFNGNKLYVTRARESFLERLQRERAEAQQNATKKHQEYRSLRKNPVIKLSEKLNPRKRAINSPIEGDPRKRAITSPIEDDARKRAINSPIEDDSKESNESMPNHKQKHTYHSGADVTAVTSSPNKKKQDSEKKRIESMKKKRQEFKQKQSIIKHGLIGVDNKQNKKTVFYDSDEECLQKNSTGTITDISYDYSARPKSDKKALFDENDEEDDDTVNFKIKEQFEGKKGQKVLDLQSRYKSDKRFILDERFVEDDQSEEEKTGTEHTEDSSVEVGQTDEKTKQLNILQDVLGISIKCKTNETLSNKKTKSKGMLRFDPLQPEHAKFLAPVREKQEPVKSSKNKKTKDTQEEESKTEEPQLEQPKVEVSKEQFYKVSETLKEAIVQPTKFSLRTLFGTKNDEKDETDGNNYIPLEPQKKQKKRNPLEPGEKNPFVYDSSESETEENDAVEKVDPTPQATNKPKHVWQENLFFTESDQRLKEGLLFFLNINKIEGQKERRELKSLMKKRIYNKERKNQMFQKKIGGKRRPTKKNYRKRN